MAKLAIRALVSGTGRLKRAGYLLRAKLGLVPHRSEMSSDDFETLQTVCVFLGPYRNLTTLTASLLSLHPNCQVFNHGGLEIFTETQLNPFADFSDHTFKRFCHYVQERSNDDVGGDRGGSITESHAFGDQAIRDAYDSRQLDESQDSIRTLVWKESLMTTNYLRQRNVNLAELLHANAKLRFLMPIRNPMDCAVSNCKTGHRKRFLGRVQNDPFHVLAAVVREIQWFQQLKSEYPNRFFSFFQYELEAGKFHEIAEFLQLGSDQRWSVQAARLCRIKPSYDHDEKMISHFRELVIRHFTSDSEFAAKLSLFADATVAS